MKLDIDFWTKCKSGYKYIYKVNSNETHHNHRWMFQKNGVTIKTSMFLDKLVVFRNNWLENEKRKKEPQKKIELTLPIGNSNKILKG